MLPFLLLLLAGAILMALRFVQLRRALLRARAGDAMFRQLAEHSLDALWLLDCATLELRYASPAAQRLSGHDLPALQEHAVRLAADVPARLQRWRDGDTSRLSLLREVELPHRDGQMLALEVTSTLVLDAAGQPVSLVGVARDVTQVQAQEAEREKEQKRFASMLSHEFRTPLSTIDGAVQRLEMTGAEHDEGTRKRYRKIQTAVDRMLAMLDEYLSPERMASIGRERQPNEICPATLLETVAEQARSRRPCVTVRTESLPQWMRCDPAGVRLCLEILLDNAIKYTTINTPIELIGKMASEGGVEFLVRDHGAGLPAAELARVFDKSFRGSNAAGIAGSGLGLYMARAVVDVHGGMLTATNVSESGTEFRIWLPIAASAGKSLARAGSSSDNSLSAS